MSVISMAPQNSAMSTNLSAAIVEWRGILGATQVLEGNVAQDVYGPDTGGTERRIPVALRIKSATHVEDVMKVASRHKVPVYPISTGRNWGYGTSQPVLDDCVVIDLSGMDRIIHFDPDMGVVTLEPGVTQGMLSAYLEERGYPFLVPVTGAGPHCSLIGNALERGYGITPHTDHWAAVTDLEAVLADGTRYRTALREAGSEELARLFKWGIGPYSAGLFSQSGFGIVTSMSIMLARRPECVQACLFSLTDDALLETAVERIHSILTTLPGVVGGINLMNRHRVLAMSAPYPFEKIGPDGLIPTELMQELGRRYQIYPWTGFITLYGTKRVVSAARQEIKNLLRDSATRMLFIGPTGARRLAKLAKLVPGRLGERIASATNMLAKSLELVNGIPNETALPLAYWRNRNISTMSCRNPSQDGCGLIWYAPLVPMRGATVRQYLDMVHRITKAHGIEPLVTLTSVGDKLFDSTVPIIFDQSSSAARTAAYACHDELLTAGRDIGVFPYRVATTAMHQLASFQDYSKEFHGRLRKGIDPFNLLAPGRY